MNHSSDNSAYAMIVKCKTKFQAARKFREVGVQACNNQSEKRQADCLVINCRYWNTAIWLCGLAEQVNRETYSVFSLGRKKIQT
jgi:hypothetical protein